MRRRNTIQFEREVTGERIRDKIAASKKKGLWMGGYRPLGYDVQDRKLVVNAAEAETVRLIYVRYLELGSVNALKASLDRNQIRSKVHVDRYGRESGGKPFGRGALYRLLQNPLYLGQIVHKDVRYAGQHDALVDGTIWEAVQRHLAENRQSRMNGSRAADPSLLAGLVYDETGERLVPTHANKRGRRYRYYVSQPLLKGRAEEARGGRRIPASDLEGLVEARWVEFLEATTDIHPAVEFRGADPWENHQIVQRAGELATRWTLLPLAERRALLTAILNRVDVMSDAIHVRVHREHLWRVLSQPVGQPTASQGFLHIGAELATEEDPRSAGVPGSLTLSIAVRLKRVGLEVRLLIEDPRQVAREGPDKSLQRLLAQAHRYEAMLIHHGGKTIAELAHAEGVSGSYFARIVRLSFMAPDIVQAVLRGRHPLELNANRLAKRVRLPISWEEQRAILGVDNSGARTTG